MATTRYIDIKVRTGSAKQQVDNLDKSVVKLGGDVKKTNAAMSQLSKVAQAVGAALIVSNIVKYADAFTSVQNQIRQTVDTTDQLASSTEALFAVANRARVGISATAELYTQLTLSTENLNLSTQETLRLTETISKSFSVSGKTAAESAGAIRQLGQAFSAGALRGDEFNSIAEGAPEIMRALQRSLGKTQGELRDFAATGGITAEILVTALEGAADVIDKKLSESVMTFAQSMEVANNNMTEFVGGSNSIQSAVSGAGGALVTISENLDTVADIAVLLSSVYAARLIPAMLSYTASITANTVAQVTQVRAVSGVSAALGVQTVALTRTAVAANVLTGSARLLSGAMAFLGGPIGVAIIAAAALVTFNDVSWDTAESAKLSSDEIDGLSASFSRMGDAAKRVTLNKLNNEMAEVRAKLISASDKLNQFKKFTDSPIKSQSITRYKAEVDSLNKELDLLSQKQGLLIGGPDLIGATNRGDISTGETEEAPKAKEDSAFSKRLSLETEALTRELNARAAVQFGFFSQEEADLSLRFQNKQARDLAALDVELTRLGADEAAKAELRLQFKEAQKLQEQIYQDEISAIEKTGSNDRVQQVKDEANLKKLTRDNDISNAQSAASAGLSLLSAFGNASFKQQKAFAIADSIINITGGVAKALNNPYPANLGFAAQVAAQGAGLLSTIKSTEPKSSGSSLSISGASASTPAVTQDFSSNDVVENTALTELTNELANRDPDELLPVSWVRRLTASIESVQGSGQG